MALLYHPRAWRDERPGVTPRAKEMTALWLLMIVLVALVVVVPTVWLLSRGPDKPPEAAAGKEDKSPQPVASTATALATDKSSDARIRDLEAALQKQAEQLQAAADERKRQEEAIARLTNENAALRQKDAAQPGEAQIKELRDQLAKLNDELQRKGKAIQELEDERKQLLALVDQLRNAAASDQSRVLAAQLGEAQRQANELRDQLNQKDEEIRGCVDKINALNSQIARLGDNAAELQRLGALTNQQAADLAASNAQIQQLQNTVNELKRQVEARDAEIHWLRSQPPVVVGPTNPKIMVGPGKIIVGPGPVRCPR
jgi:DNA repair exonuclease SbcCD ATPase subunit